MYLQLVYQIKALIATGRVKPDEELPSVRALSQQLVLNPNTVVRAYRELESEGLIYKKRGAGTFVSSDVTPTYTEAVCRRILGERMDGVVVEGMNMGFDEAKLLELFRERWDEMQQQKSKEEGDQS